MLRRCTAALGAVLLLTVAAACGTDSTPKADSSSGLKAVSFTGAVGKTLKPTWKSKATAPKATTTLVKGKGAKVATGDTISLYLWLGNGSTKKEAYSDYTNGQPESVPNDGTIPPWFTKLLKDATYGSRVATVISANDLFGSTSGNPQLGIGAKDNVVVVADIVEKAEVSPTPTDDQVHDAPAKSLPKVVVKDGKPTDLDWTGIAEPELTTPVQRVVLKEGKGAVVKATDTLTVNYLGETYKATTPFDESYTKQPITQALSGLIQGWSIGLTGVKVGSRVLIQIPPLYGYGAQGGGSTIPGNATLWFVIDVVSAK